MRYLPAAALTLLAAILATIGGALQGANGPGTQPGITLTHLAAAVVVAAAIAAVIGWLTREPRPADDKYAYVTATDGQTVIPVVGPYETEWAAYDELPSAKQQFDPDGRYAWTVQTTSDPSAVVEGVANTHFKTV